jgi:hypothetical protein
MQEVTPRQPVTEVDGFVGVEPEHCASLKGAASSQLSGSQRSPVSNCLLARNSVLMASFSNKMTPSAQAALNPEPDIQEIQPRVMRVKDNAALNLRGV